MTQDDALMQLCQDMLGDSYVVEQEGWQKLVLVGEVGEGSVSMGGYSYDLPGKCQMVSPAASNLKSLKQLHAVMKAANPTGRGWLKCMLRISRAGEVGADFEYDYRNRWIHTSDNYKERIQEYAAMPA